MANPLRAAILTGCFFISAASVMAAAPDPRLFNENVRTTDPLPPQDQRAAFHVPDGFEVQLVAAEPEIGKPIGMAFDARGRLWITESREYPFPAKSAPARDKIRILTIDPQTGRATKIDTFAEGLNIPLGLYPYKNGVIAFSIPNISYYADTDGDGKSDQTRRLYGTFGQRDTHGITNSFRRGFDGWLYATHGFSNSSNIKGADGHTFTMNSGNIYRMRVDGSRAEQFAWGPVNPFGMALDPAGNLYMGDCHSDPITQILRGAWYPHFGNPHDGLGFGPRMMTHSHGSTAIAGVAGYFDDRFPREYQGNFFVGNPMTCRINRDVITYKGSSPVAIEQPDFLSCDDPWFRPVDVQLGPDGALYIADFYNRIIGHYEVPLDHPGRDRERGRIWRIVATKNAPRPALDLTVANATGLVAALTHPNATYRHLAANELFDRLGASAVPTLEAALNKPQTVHQHVHILWLLHRLGALEEQMLEAAATSNSEALIRVHALRILGETPEWKPSHFALAYKGLSDADPLARRCAADGLSIHILAGNLRPLLDALHSADKEDTHLVHTLRMALRNHYRDASMFAVSIPNLTERDTHTIAAIAPAIPSTAAARFLLEHVRKHPGQTSAYIRHITRYAPDTETENVIALCRQTQSDDLDLQLALCKSVQEGSAQRGAPAPASARAWAHELADRLLTTPINQKRKRAQRQQGAAELAIAFNLTDLQPAMVKLLADTSADPAARIVAARAVGRLSSPTSAIEPLSRILMNGAEPMNVRDQAAQSLAEIKHDDARAAVLVSIPAVPRSLQLKLATALASDAAGANQLLDAIRAGKAPAALVQEAPVKERLVAAKIPDLDKTLAELTRGLPDLDAQRQKMIDERRAGFNPINASADRGAQLYTTNCAACHAIGGAGGNVGPNLDGIGARGVERLIEDILDPNRNVDPAFYHSIIDTKSGDTLVGLARREEGAVLVFADSTGKEFTLAKADIKKRRETRRSLMPENFHELLKPQELHDVIAYLLARTPPAPK